MIDYLQSAAFLIMVLLQGIVNFQLIRRLGSVERLLVKVGEFVLPPKKRDHE